MDPIAAAASYREISRCRACHSAQLDPVFSLGALAVNDFPTDPNHTRVFAPLDVVRCAACTLVQLAHTFSRDYLFKDQYWYASGINGLMREELRTVVRRARQFARVEDHDWVLDIGANDGTLLAAWREHAWEGKPRRIAVEPALVFRDRLRDVSDMTLIEPFPSENLAPLAGQIKVITTIAMFYSVDALVPFVQQVANLLAKDGLWVVQFQDLHQMLQQTAFDNICHEHVTYPTLTSVSTLANQHGLVVLHAEQTPINGGSLRVFLGFPHRQAVGTADVAFGSLYSEEYRSCGRECWPAFQQRVEDRVAHLRGTLEAAKANGHTVDLLGASTKGNTLLQVAGVGPQQVRQVWERHPEKIGRYTVTGVPIVGEEAGRMLPPDLLICPIWQFRSGVVAREREYLQQGGRIYFPLPTGELHMWGGDATARESER